MADMILRDEAQDLVDAVASLHKDANEKLTRSLADNFGKDRIIKALQLRLADAEERIDELEAKLARANQESAA